MFRILIVCAVAVAVSLAAADFSGKWTGAMETNGTRVRLFLTMERCGGDGCAGTMATGDDAKQVPIQNAVIQGDAVSFEVADNAGRTVKFRLALNGPVLRGEAEVGGRTSRVSVSRVGGGGGSRNADSSGFNVGYGRMAPTVIFKKDPEYTEEARKARYQGTVLLAVEIDPTGAATNIRVVRGLGLGLDEKAVEAVKQWKFKPGMKDGKPVTVSATIEVNFRL